MAKPTYELPTGYAWFLRSIQRTKRRTEANARAELVEGNQVYLSRLVRGDDWVSIRPAGKTFIVSYPPYVYTGTEQGWTKARRRTPETAMAYAVKIANRFAGKKVPA